MLSLIGGYIGSRVGKLELYRDKKNAEIELERLKKKKAKIEARLDELNTAVEEGAKKTEAEENKKCSLK
jgi:hypothetical protein